MKKIFALALVAVFCLAGYGVSAQTQSKNQKLSPKQEKREAREQRRAQRQAEYERYIDSLVTSGNFQFIPNSMRVMPAGSEHLITNPNFGLQYWDGEFDIFLPYVKGAVMPYYLTVLNYTIFQSRGDPSREQSPQRLGGHFRHFALLCDQVCLYAGYLCQTGGATLTITNSWNITVQYSGTITFAVNGGFRMSFPKYSKGRLWISIHGLFPFVEGVFLSK